MNKLVRLYNQNRKSFWAIIISVILVFIVLQSLNKNYKENNPNEETNGTRTNSITITNESKNYSIISEKEITENENENAESIIKQFIDYCNSKDIESAYELLSQDCKNELYPTIEEFDKNYVASLFKQEKMYEAQLWRISSDKYTYLIKFMEDILATGNSSNSYIQEYYTIIKQEDQYKLNINGFIYKEIVNTEKQQENINFKVLEKNVYNKYEEYVIEIENLTSSNICIDKKESTKTMYITSSKELNYYANLYEIANNSLVLKPGETNTYTIKYEKGYRDNELTKTINFCNIILNYNLENERNAEVIIEL